MATPHILQVSELTKKVRFMLESELNTVWLCGEISNFIAASSGHWYLSLKDSKSQVKCAMFKGNNLRVRISPRNGQQVLVRAKVSLYEPRGDFQIIIEQMDDAGEGLLRQQFDQLKNKLNNEGLFSQATKQKISDNIKCVGIITSPTGAAIKDILSILKRRNPLIKVIIYPALVQGEQAKSEICTAIKTANVRAECDVLIVGRGGGSLEDLWSFNEESVVRAIYNSKIPTISAVGHEIDTTLSDYVSDLRAATPSAAAELISTNMVDMFDKLIRFKQLMINANNRKFIEYHSLIDSLQHRLSQAHPAQQLQLQQQKVDELNIRLKQAIKRELQRFNQPTIHLRERLLHISPIKDFQIKKGFVQQIERRIAIAIKRNYQQKTELFSHLIEQLQMLSPLATLARGYSIVRNKDANIIQYTKEVIIGEKITTQIIDGKIISKVLSIEKGNTNL